MNSNSNKKSNLNNQYSTINKNNLSPMSLSSLSSMEKLNSHLETSVNRNNFIIGKVKSNHYQNLLTTNKGSTNSFKDFYFISGCPSCGFNGNVRWVCDKCFGYLYINSKGEIKCYDCMKSFNILDAVFDCSNHEEFGTKYQGIDVNRIDYNLKGIKTETGMSDELYNTLVNNIQNDNEMRKY